MSLRQLVIGLFAGISNIAVLVVATTPRKCRYSFDLDDKPRHSYGLELQLIDVFESFFIVSCQGTHRSSLPIE